MEKDDEVKGEGNSYTTEFRQYDPRISRWLTIDPAFIKYPEISPYVALNNNPLFFTDPFGDDPPQRIKFWSRVGNFLRHKGNINKANKYAIKNGLDLCYTDDGNIPIVVDPETREAKVFLNRGYMQSRNLASIDFQFLTTEEMLYDILEDYGGITGILNQKEDVNYLGSLNLKGGEFYDDLVGLKDDNNIYVKISYTNAPLIIENGFGRVKLRWKSGNYNAVYMRMKLMPNGQRLPYIGKAFNILSRYSSFVRNSSNLKTIVSKITNKDLLRAVEQKFINYVKLKTNGNSANIRNAMNAKDYSKYSQQVDDLLKGTDWQRIINNYFNFK